MTLPTNNLYPIVNTSFRDNEEIRKYLRDLIFALEERDSQLADAINGDIRSNAFVQREQWTPVLKGSVTAGTFTYTQQVGWVFRQGLFVDVWFDIIWTANAGAAGNLYVELPYKVALSSGKPFVGPLQTATIAYGAGHTVLTINAIPNTFRGEIWASGSAVATANIAVAAAGQLIGHVRYLGVADER